MVVKLKGEHRLDYYNRKQRHSGLDYRTLYGEMLVATTEEDTLAEL
jgi:hypothetical protein